jgi:IclR-like helix-turn-helix domain-containing protein
VTGRPAAGPRRLGVNPVGFILAKLAADGPCSAAALAAAAPMAPGTMYAYLRSLMAHGQVVKTGPRLYALPGGSEEG